MSKNKKWVVNGLLAGQVHIPEKDTNLPIRHGKIEITPYAFFIQNLNLSSLWHKQIYLGLKIPTNLDHVFIAWQEMETFMRAIGMDKNIWVSVEIFNMTDKQEEWPDEIKFLNARNFPYYKETWQPVDHFKDIKNRVRNLAKNPPKGSGSLSLKDNESGIERMNNPILVTDDYISALIKDYMMGIEEERSHPSLALLYYFKVLERVGKTEFGENLKKGSLSLKTMNKMVDEIDHDLTNEDKIKAKEILRLRHNMSEAHLMIEGIPERQQLFPCKKMAYFYVLKAINSKI